MLKLHGWIGILLIVLTQINILFHIEPFASWYIPIIWFGYIFLIDSIVFKLKGKSLIVSFPREFLKIVLLSVPIWGVYEIYNLVIQNWVYNEFYTIFIHLVDFTIILPAILETKDLFLALGWFKKTRGKPLDPSKLYLTRVILFGVFFAVVPLLLPMFFFWSLWFADFLLFDPINYLLGNDSLIGDFKKGKRERFYAIGFSGMLCGLLWEFWNYWALPKWFYTVPFVDFWKVFEMPLIGYLGYFPFALGMFATYHFVKGLFECRERDSNPRRH